MHEILKSYFDTIGAFVSVLEVYNAIILQNMSHLSKFLTQKEAQIFAPSSANRKTPSKCYKGWICVTRINLKTI